MLISFVITYFNEPIELLRACVTSILALPLGDEEREIIVIDDGSEASPAEALRQIDSGIVCHRQENQGLSVARNTGITLAHGQYIQFVDGDDMLSEGYSRCIEHIRRGDADVIMFRFMTFVDRHDRADNNHEEPPTPEFQGMAHDYLTHFNLRAAACCYAFRRNILGDLRFMSGIYHEDELFTPQLLLRAKGLVSLNVRAYLYRQRAGSITHARDNAKKQKRLNDAERVIMALNELSKTEGCTILTRRIHQLSMDYLYNILRETHSFKELRQRRQRLRNAALYPLPMRRYTAKYLIFSLLTHIF